MALIWCQRCVFTIRLYCGSISSWGSLNYFEVGLRACDLGVDLVGVESYWLQLII